MSIPMPSKAYQSGAGTPLFSPQAQNNHPASTNTAAQAENAQNAKAEGIEWAELAAIAAGPSWNAAAYCAARQVLETRGIVTAAMVWEELRKGDMTETDHPAAMGAVFARLGREKLARNTGMTVPSDLQRTHGRPLALWCRPNMSNEAAMAAAGIAKAEPKPEPQAMPVTITRAWAAVQNGRPVSHADSRQEPGTTAVLIVHGISGDKLKAALIYAGMIVK